MKYKIFILFLISLMFCSCCERKSDIADNNCNDYAGYITPHYKTPTAYVIDKFKEHDVVILGESHYNKHDPLFVQHLIPALYKNGIYYLAMEFARREDQPLIDSLLNGNQYDEQLAREIVFNQYVFWGFREYVDIFKAAWEFNQTLAEGERKFSVLGINDSPDWSVFKKPGDEQIDSLRILAWRGGSERKWAQVVMEKVFNNEKVLAYCGMHHAFSEFLQPIVSGDNKFIRFEDARFGHYFYLRFGKRVITIYLHSIWENDDRSHYKPVRPAEGIIDHVMDSLGSEYYPIGFDITGTPFADIVVDNAIYKYGYQPLRLGKYCDGWIFTKPLSQYETVTAIDNFINDSNIEQARKQSPNPKMRNASVEQFNNAIKSALEEHKQSLRELEN